MKRLLTCLVVLAIAASATATDVSGPITTTTWTAANSPYRVTDSISVPAGNTLTIEPGVDVLFDKDVPFTIDGMIRALGSSAGRISFGRGTASAWGGLQMRGPTENLLDHVDVRGVTAITQTDKLLPSDSEAGDEFGSSIAVDGDVIVVGTWRKGGATGFNTGAAYIFHRTSLGTDNWRQVRKITASDAEQAALFGSSVAVDGDVVVVGSPSKDAAGPNAGAAYIFHRNDGGTDNWGEVKKITASDAEEGTGFGSSVAVDGGVIVVLAGGSVNGAAYVFVRNSGGPDNWGEVRKITPGDAHEIHWFGSSVATNGEVIVVGAQATDYWAGAVYVFHRNSGGTDNWGEVKKLTARDTGRPNYFGLLRSSIAVDGDVIVVGASIENTAAPSAGVAYIFHRNTGGTNNWGEIRRVTASDAQESDYFGSSVDVDGDVVVVGATGEDAGGWSAGATYAFYRNVGGTDNWGEVRRITASDAQRDNYFGERVSVDGDVVVVGATGADAVYVFGVPETILSSHKIAMDISSTVSLSHSTVTGNDVGLSTSTGGAVLISNSTIAGNAIGIRTSTLDDVISLKNSIVWSPILSEGTMSATYSCNTVSLDGTGNISSNPRFNDTDNGDYTLQWGSPCIDAGDPSILDPDGTRLDIGAFAFPHGVSVESSHPTPTTLLPNAPNPFNPSTTIPFTLADDGVVSLCIYNVMGQQVRTLVSDHRAAGYHAVTWNGRDDRGKAVASGVYLYRLAVGGDVMVKRMTLVR
jgi:hypothetical protein